MFFYNLQILIQIYLQILIYKKVIRIFYIKIITIINLPILNKREQKRLIRRPIMSSKHEEQQQKQKQIQQKPDQQQKQIKQQPKQIYKQRFGLKIKQTKQTDYYQNANEKQIVLNELSKDQRYEDNNENMGEQQSQTKSNNPHSSNRNIELQNLVVQSPLKKTIVKNTLTKQNNTKSASSKSNLIKQDKKQTKHHHTNSYNKKDSTIILNESQRSSSNQIRSSKSLSKSKLIQKNNKKTNKTFYQETYYITGMKQNYLLLLSDNNQVLQFPIGMFTIQGGSTNQEDSYEDKNNSNQLVKDIKIGQPIKIKLEIDYFRQQKDQKLFNSLQKNVHQQYSNQNQRQSNFGI